ncbi:WIPF2 protein, partial [Aphelocoma coerulescens]|nr:WIPF2 protein [Aphelocoma coerulescens]
MPIPPPPPPPPGPPPPPTLSQANTEPPKLSREEQRGRGALLQDICKGTKLRKVTQINDRSAPILEKPKGSGSSSYGSSSAAIQPKGGLFQGGVPKLRPVGAKDSSDSSTKQTLQVPGARAAAPRPPVPASNSRPQDDADSSRGSPPELPRTQRPSLPDLLRSGAQGQSLAPPPPPYRQPPGVPNGPSSPSSESAPELPQRHNSLHRKAPGPLRGLAPPPPTAASPSLQSSRPPPPARDPPSRGAGKSCSLCSAWGQLGRGTPAWIPLGAEPCGFGQAPPEPPSLTCPFSRFFTDDFESKYSFHPVEDFPAPEEYKYFQRIYPSKTNRATRGAPPLPPIPR